MGIPKTSTFLLVDLKPRSECRIILKLMIELTLLTLLNFVGNNFCEYRNVGHDNYKSLLLAYSDASEKFGPLKVKKIIEKSDNFKVAAIAIAAVKCPQHIME